MCALLGFAEFAKNMKNHTMQSASRKGTHYRPGELEVILSLAPTAANIGWLNRLLGRSEAAIEVVYKIAYEHGPLEGGPQSRSGRSFKPSAALASQ